MKIKPEMIIKFIKSISIIKFLKFYYNAPNKTVCSICVKFLPLLLISSSSSKFVNLTRSSRVSSLIAKFYPNVLFNIR